ncbi:MAG: hypothetical protein JXR10_04295 [Cyclobacteriaceae bacterium]
MNKIFFCLLILTTQFLSAQKIDTSKILNIEPHFQTGVAHADFAWNIAGNINGQNPNILSELIWQDLMGWSYNAGTTLQYGNTGLEIVHARTSIIQGEATDTDYNEDDRQEVFFSAQLNGRESYSSKLSAQFFYVFSLDNDLEIIPAIGLTRIDELFRLTDNRDRTLNSTYAPKWTGVNFKIKAHIPVSNAIRLVPVFEYMQLNYLAVANWNKIELFKHPVSFEHVAKGYGIETGMMISWKVCSQISLQLRYDYRYLTTGKGTETLYLANDTTIKTLVNDVSGNSGQLLFGLTFSLY